MKLAAIALAAALLAGCGAAAQPQDTVLSEQAEIVEAFTDNREAFEAALAFLQEEAQDSRYSRTEDGVTAYDSAQQRSAPIDPARCAPIAALFEAVPVQDVSGYHADDGFYASFEFYFSDFTPPDSGCAATFESGVGYGAMESARSATELDCGWYYYEDWHP